MTIKSINTDTSNMPVWCVVEGNLYTGKIYAIHDTALKSQKNLMDHYRENWKEESIFPTIFGVVEMGYEELVDVTSAKEKEGGNYYLKTPYFKTEAEVTDYETIFPSSLECDYTCQIYQNGEPWPITGRVTITRDSKIDLLIKSEKLTGDFRLKVRTKPEGTQDIELLPENQDGKKEIDLGSLTEGELIVPLYLNQIDFKWYNQIELKVEHPDSGNSYLGLQII